MRILAPTLLLGLLGLLVAVSSSPAQDIDTRTATTEGSLGIVGNMRPTWTWDWPGGMYISRAYGQTFTITPGWTELNEFAFWLRGYLVDANYDRLPSDILFSAYLMAWDPVTRRPQGELLWRSERQEGPGSGDDYVRYGFETGGVTLDPSSMYVAFLAAHDDLLNPLPLGESRLAAVAGSYASSSDAYAGGTAVYTDLGVVPGTGPTLPFTRSYWSVSSWEDAQFTADFGPAPTSTVPEPASMALLGSGLAALAGWRRRRRGSREA